MLVKTFDVKIQMNKVSRAQKEALETIFLEQKWYKNYILNWSEQSDKNKITKFDTKLNDITKKRQRYERCSSSYQISYRTIKAVPYCKNVCKHQDIAHLKD